MLHSVGGSTLKCPQKLPRFASKFLKAPQKGGKKGLETGDFFKKRFTGGGIP
jgi:hypothetical protein